ncbi:MAG TPA: NrsF family protein, partial [Acetobacteraceae bacterium]|nr:NrsF family protein [Acetobacteraceae bacterium]
GLGCLRSWAVPGTHDADARSCLVFIVGVSLPLSALLLAMLRRARPLRPTRTAVLGGLAAASASATLLNLFHPYDAAATDVAVHALAVLIVIVGNRAIGVRAFAGQDS